MGNSVLEITDSEFSSEVLDAKQPVLAYFWAPWCGPCRMIAPAIEELASDYEGKVLVGKLNVDENPNISMEFGVRSIPTILIIKDGTVVDKHVGVASKKQLADKVNAHLVTA